MTQPNVPLETGVAFLVAGAFVKVLPPMAAALAISWYGIQIWQSETGRGWRTRWKRLFRRQLTAEDRMSFVLLVCGGMGVLLTMYGLSRVMQ